MNFHPRASGRSISRLHRSPSLFAATVLAVLALPVPPAAAHDYRFGDIAIVHAWIGATPEGAGVSAGYVTIRNKGSPKAGDHGS